MKRLIVFLVLVVLAGTCWAGKIYTWKDANGIPVISDKPPREGEVVRGDIKSMEYQNRNRDIPSNGNDDISNISNDSEPSALVTMRQEQQEQQEQEEISRQYKTQRAATISAELARLKDLLEKTRNAKQPSLDGGNTSGWNSMRSSEVKKIENDIWNLEKNPDVYFSTKKHQVQVQPPPVINDNPNVHKQNNGVFDQYGNYYTPSGEGLVSTKDGTYYAPSGPNGYVNTKTGKFMWAH